MNKDTEHGSERKTAEKQLGNDIWNDSEEGQ